MSVSYEGGTDDRTLRATASGVRNLQAVLERYGYVCQTLQNAPSAAIREAVNKAISGSNRYNLLLLHIIGHVRVGASDRLFLVGDDGEEDVDIGQWLEWIGDARRAPAVLLVLDVENTAAARRSIESRVPHRRLWLVAPSGLRPQAFEVSLTAALTRALNDHADGRAVVDPVSSSVLPLSAVLALAERYVSRRQDSDLPQAIMSVANPAFEPPFFPNPAFRSDPAPPEEVPSSAADPRQVRQLVEPPAEEQPARDEALTHESASGSREREHAGFIADTPSGADQLGFAEDVWTLCDVITAKEIKPPLSVGLFGDWGTGKSFFMGMMRDRIAELAQLSRAARTEGRPTAYCASVCQIDFNAWHYVDANLWASLTGTILDRLADQLDETTTGEALRDLPSIRAQRSDLEIRRAEARHQLAAATRDLAAEQPIGLRDVFAADVVTAGVQDRIDTALVNAGVPAGQMNLREAATDLRGTLGRLLYLLRRGTAGTRALLIALVGLTIFVPIATVIAFTVLDQTLVGLVLAAAPVLAGALAVKARIDRAKPILALAQEIVRAADERRQEPIRTHQESLRRLIERYEAELRGISARIETLERGESLRSFAADRRAGDDYRRHEGLVAVVRRDLEELSRRLAGTPDVERIVLYIDDLDRCPPGRVVEVLQAVNLLLAFPLFVVVVGVDVRWLIRSLELHYRQVFGRQDANDGAHWSSTPQNYLEKIFQLSVNLRPLSGATYRSLLAEMLLSRDHEPADDKPTDDRSDGSENAGAPLTSTPSPESADEDVLTPGPNVDTPDVDALLIRSYPVTSTVAEIAFVGDGGYLVAVLDDGTVTRWDTRTDRSTGRSAALWDGPLDTAAIAPSGHVLVAGSGSARLIDGVGLNHLGDVAVPGATGRAPMRATLAADGSTGWLAWPAEHWMLGRIRNLASDRELAGEGITLEPAHVLSGILIAIGPGWYLLRSSPYTLDIWRPGGERHELRGPGGAVHMSDEAARATVAATDSRGGMLAIAGPAVPLQVWRVGTEPTLTAKRTRLWREAISGRQVIAVNENGWVAVAHRGMVVVWNLNEVCVACQFRVPAAPNRLAFSPDGRRLAVASASGVAVFAVAEPVGPDLSAMTLRLSNVERQALLDVGPLIATPRSAKRLFNTYRLLRAGLAPDARTRLKDGEVGPVILLLAMLIGHPGPTATLLDRLINDNSVVSLTGSIASSHAALLTAVQHVQATSKVTDNVAPYRQWAHDVARFSFRTGHLARATW